jgi:hypothetical protein
MRLALLALMVSAEAPGPRIETFLPRLSAPLDRLIVPLRPKAIVSPGAAFAIAWRSEPLPLSASEVTMFVAECAAVAMPRAMDRVSVKVNDRPAGLFMETVFIAFLSRF